MERLILIVEQLEESKRLILIGGIPQLRMALLLLDNAAELLMYRQVTEEFYSVLIWENLLRQWIEIQESEREPERKQKVQAEIDSIRPRIISDAQKRDIQKYFDEKVKFLVRKDMIGHAEGEVLSAIHRYRNLAYHQEKLRKETIRPVVFLLFEVVCHLFVSISPVSIGICSGDDFSSFESRYGGKGFEFLDEDGRQHIANQLREGLPLEAIELRDALHTHLEKRFDDINSSLEFIAENTQWKDDYERTLKRVQFWKLRPGEISDDEFQRFVPKYTMQMFQDWHGKVKMFHTIEGKVEIFTEFARLERMLEPIEEWIHDAASDVDRAISLEVDRQRGK